jgi:hypothetical protein
MVTGEGHGAVLFFSVVQKMFHVEQKKGEAIARPPPAPLLAS